MTESESADESPERHVSLRPHDDMIDTTSPACISTPVIIASPAVHSRIQMTTRKSMLGLLPVMMPARSAALRRASDLLPPRKRYKGTSAMHSDGPSDEGSPVTQAESDMDLDIQAYVEAVTATAATTIVDGLSSEPVLAGVEAGFKLGLAVVETESEPEEAEADEEADAESWPKARVVALEGSNMRLRDPLGVKRVRADSLQRCLGYVEEELRQVHELRAHESQRLWRMETFMTRTHDYRP
nr:hypothetical protein [Tanacetum cinerariifolium]